MTCGLHDQSLLTNQACKASKQCKTLLGCTVAGTPVHVCLVLEGLGSIPEGAGALPAVLGLWLKAGQHAVQLEAQVSIDLTEGRLCQSLIKHLHHDTHTQAGADLVCRCA